MMLSKAAIDEIERLRIDSIARDLIVWDNPTGRRMCQEVGELVATVRELYAENNRLKEELEQAQDVVTVATVLRDNGLISKTGRKALLDLWNALGDWKRLRSQPMNDHSNLGPL